jgi:hypothetical protein
MTFTPTTMAGLKRSLKCDDLLTMTISQQQQQSGNKESSCRSSLSCSGSSTGLDSRNEQQSLVLISQFVQLRTTSSSTPAKRQRFATSTKNPATAALECLEASWDYRSFQTAVAMMSN